MHSDPVFLYALADTHLSFSTEKPMGIFGARWKDHSSKIEKHWRETVKENDTVVIPGDISWGMTLDEAYEDLMFIDSLPGKKIISRGNHDYWWQTAKKINEFFVRNGISTIELLHNNAYLFGDCAVCGSRGWYNDQKSAPEDADYNKIVNRECQRLELSLKYGLELCAKEDTADRTDHGDETEDIKGAAFCKNFAFYKKEPVVFLHFPPVFKSYLCREIVDVLHKYSVKRCFYGHIHSVYDFPRTSDFEGIDFTCVSADYLNFVPYRII